MGISQAGVGDVEVYRGTDVCDDEIVIVRQRNGNYSITVEDDGECEAELTREQMIAIVRAVDADLS